MNTPLINIGDTMYRIRYSKINKQYRIEKIICTNITNLNYFVYEFTNDDYYAFDKDINKKIFYTEEDANKYIHKLQLKDIKKQKLKEYEQKLNKELGITSVIIK